MQSLSLFRKIVRPSTAVLVQLRSSSTLVKPGADWKPLSWIVVPEEHRKRASEFLCVDEENALKLRYYTVELDLNSSPMREGGPLPAEYSLPDEKARGYHFPAKPKGVVGTVWAGPKSQGPHGLVHGGAMAAILDEVCGLSAWVNDMGVLAANLSVSIRNRTPINAEYCVLSWMEKLDGRKAFLRGAVIGKGGEVMADAHLLAIEPRDKRTTA